MSGEEMDPRRKEMDPERLSWARDFSESHATSGAMLHAVLSELLADRDYHHARAETAEAEAAQTLADCAAYKRERDEAWRELAALRGELIR